jgi:hypothetical protein
MLLRTFLSRKMKLAYSRQHYNTVRGAVEAHNGAIKALPGALEDDNGDMEADNGAMEV